MFSQKQDEYRFMVTNIEDKNSLIMKKEKFNYAVPNAKNSYKYRAAAEGEEPFYGIRH